MPFSIVLDVLLCLMLLFYTVHGLQVGLVQSLGGIVGVIVGAVAAFFAIPLVAGWVSTSAWRLPIVLIVVLLLLGLGQALGGRAGRFLRRRLEKSPLRGFDRLFGAAVTLVVAAIVTSMLAFGLGSLGAPFISQAIGSSAVIRTIDDLTPNPVKSLEAQVRGLVAEDGLPRLFDAIGTGEPLVVPDAGSDTAAQQAAAKSVVKIVGNAYQCGQNQSGSGFVVSSGRIVTNAHVVAGVDQPVVEAPNGGAWTGKVVYFDSAADLAVVAVSGMPTPALQLGTDLKAGDDAVFDGYPLGGPFSSSPAAVQSINTVDVPDIYGGDPAPRKVYYLAAQVQEGNSGGPLLDAAGKVVGVVFAKSATTKDLGFAMTTDTLRSVAAEAPTLSSAVASGHCTAG
ncbi:MAG TPA: MarP family serine protease [Lacisediminihabitans sp.]|uniref:MarP family serine protease n=1 Tax=Lacisediminihabitans sp. TaxID=2787631 RepID=UPI002ED89758